jgi:hypothetical protein
MRIKGKVINLWAKYAGMFIPVHTCAEEQMAEIEIELTEKDINQTIRDHFSTVLQKDDIMTAIVEAGNGAAKHIKEKLENAD